MNLSSVISLVSAIIGLVSIRMSIRSMCISADICRRRGNGDLLRWVTRDIKIATILFWLGGVLLLVMIWILLFL